MKMKIFIFIIILISCTNSKEKDAKRNKQSQQQIVVDVKALAKKANLFYEQNRCVEAIACYDSLILIDSAKGGYYFKRGYCKASLLNNPDGAIADYKKAIELDYSEKKSAYLNLGVMYWIVLNKPDSTIYFYDHCLKIEPTNEKAKQQRQAILGNLKKLH